MECLVRWWTHGASRRQKYFRDEAEGRKYAEQLAARSDVTTVTVGVRPATQYKIEVVK